MYTSEGKQIIQTGNAPKAIGPYSQAVRIQDMVFASGQIGLDPTTGEFVSNAVEDQTRQVLINLTKVLEAADSGLKFVIKTTVFLKDINDFAKMNGVYGEFFPDHPH